MAEPRLWTGPAAGPRARAEARPLLLQPSRALGRWLTGVASRLNQELGADLITPAHVAHRLLMEARERELRELFAKRGAR